MCKRIWFSLPLLIIIAINTLYCVQKGKPTKVIRIAKTVLTIIKDAGEAQFSKHQDTILYAGKYYTGYKCELYDSKDTASLQSYFNGVEEGWQLKWYPNHQIMEERFYINGRKQDRQQGWWPDGKVKFLFNTVDDEYEGEFKEWYASGLLGKDFHYVHGQEEGSQKLWWDNGTVRANYVIKNGKKYGLLGLKTCSNPYDSIYKK
jgi:antitoxin component YwqK of YwqJK toxin-antitoxin module